MTDEFSEELIQILKKNGIEATINNVGHVYINIQSLPGSYAKLIR